MESSVQSVGSKETTNSGEQLLDSLIDGVLNASRSFPYADHKWDPRVGADQPIDFPQAARNLLEKAIQQIPVVKPSNPSGPDGALVSSDVAELVKVKESLLASVPEALEKIDSYRTTLTESEDGRQADIVDCPADTSILAQATRNLDRLNAVHRRLLEALGTLRRDLTTTVQSDRSEPGADLLRALLNSASQD